MFQLPKRAGFPPQEDAAFGRRVEKKVPWMHLQILFKEQKLAGFLSTLGLRSLMKIGLLRVSVSRA